MEKDDKRKYGMAGGPIPATDVLVKPLDSSYFAGRESYALIIFNRQAGTRTSANVYGGKGGDAGRNWDPKHYTWPIPAKGDKKWQKWAADGYVKGNVAEWAILRPVQVDDKAGKDEPAAKA